MEDLYYPQSPNSLPKNLTSLTPSYQLKAFLAIIAIFLFFALYASLVIGLAYLTYYAFTYEMVYINKLTILLKVGAIAGSAMLFVFTLKFIFKLKNHKPQNRIKLDKNEYPQLWRFVERICAETGAPKPKNIYADPDVNAYVSYANMWLSLFLPVKKELTIGLGLVSCLNLTEFKAVISHEFGHFAQRSMKIGSYIISANTIIHDMIFSRDKWDDLLDQWRASDIRLSAAAWVITPIIWLIRQILNLFYQFLNVMYSSLSREMEFNADKVAISTSGSDSILAALWNLDHGFTNWNSTINHAYLASQKKMFVSNLYAHNDLAKERSLANTTILRNGLPIDERGGVMYFSESEHSKVGMYSSHPPNDKRQNNAKIPYVKCDVDDRSPWLLFEKMEELQTQMTSLVYDQYLNKKELEFSNPEAFESFIAVENQGKDILESYDNTFENRFFNIPDTTILEAEAIASFKKSDYNAIKLELKQLMKPVKEIEGLMQKASQIAEGTTKENSFAFKGQLYKKKNLQEGYTSLFKERETLFTESFTDWDKSYCSLHYALAKNCNKHEELMDLYEQHKQITLLYKSAMTIKNTIYSELNELQSREVIESDVTRFKNRVNDLVYSLNDNLDTMESMDFVKLPNIDTKEELREAIIEGGLFKKESGNIFENGGFNTLMQSLENAILHCQRIDQKSIGVILSYHKKLQAELV